jgi:hypothetical protein
MVCYHALQFLKPPTGDTACRQHGGGQDLRTECYQEEERGAQLPQASIASGCRGSTPQHYCKHAGVFDLKCFFLGGGERRVCECSYQAVPIAPLPPRAPTPPLLLQTINKSMVGIVRSLDVALKANNLEKVAQVSARDWCHGMCHGVSITFYRHANVHVHLLTPPPPPPFSPPSCRRWTSSRRCLRTWMCRRTLWMMP